jgi:hypothetical protein
VQALCSAMNTLDLHNRRDENWALLKRPEAKNEQLVLFVHGYGGTYLGTWGKLPKLLQSNANGDPVLKNWDYLFIGYDTQSLFTFFQIAQRIAQEWEWAENDHRSIGRKYKRFALVGHSLGTLGIRQLLCAYSIQPDQMFSKLHSVTLFGTPTSGSILAWFSPWSIGDSLRPYSPAISMLHQWVQAAHEHNNSFSHQSWPPVKLIHGQADRVVRTAARDMIKWAGDADKKVLSAYGHVDMTKPKQWESTAIDLLREACS